MPKFVIERDIPGAGGLTQEELQAESQKSCGVLDKLGAQIQRIHSCATDDNIYCIYTAPSQELIEQHARESGFPGNGISEVKALIDPPKASNEIL